MWAKKQQSGFTIVELLIVIVVIGILAAITIVAYNGIQNRARSSATMNGLNSSRKKLELYKIDNSTYPTTGNLGAAGIANGDTTYQYTSDGSTYCITGTNGSISYKATETTAPVSGGCAGHGQGGAVAITNLVTNPSFETNIADWNAPGNQAPTISKSTDYAQVGSSSMKVVYDGPAYGGDPNQQRMATTISGLTSGKKYTVSAYVKLTTGRKFFLYIDNAYGSGVRSTNSSPWQRISTSFTADSTTKEIGFYGSESAYDGALNSGSTNYTSTPFIGYIDAVMVTQSDNALTYADGNSSNWIWNGTTNNSSSTGPTLP